MESRRSKCMESIYTPSYNIPPIVASFPSVLPSPDTELPPKIAPTAQCHAHPPLTIKRSSNRVIKTVLRSVRRLLKHTNISARSIHSFRERWALQVARYRGTRQITDIHPVLPIIHGISTFQLHRIYQETRLQYSPNTWVLATCSDMSRCRNTALIFDDPEFFCCCH